VEYESLVHQSDIDPAEGASIDRLEDIANQRGLIAQQIMLMYVHEMTIGAAEWESWARRGSLRAVLMHQLADSGITADAATTCRRPTSIGYDNVIFAAK